MRHHHINGHILGTASQVQVSNIALNLSHDDAYALCNLLLPNVLDKQVGKGKYHDALLRIGRDLGLLVDHSSRDNLGKFYVGIGEDVQLQLEVQERRRKENEDTCLDVTRENPTTTEVCCGHHLTCTKPCTVSGYEKAIDTIWKGIQHWRGDHSAIMALTPNEAFAVLNMRAMAATGGASLHRDRDQYYCWPVGHQLDEATKAALMVDEPQAAAERWLEVFLPFDGNEVKFNAPAYRSQVFTGTVDLSSDIDPATLKPCRKEEL